MRTITPPAPRPSPAAVHRTCERSDVADEPDLPDLPTVRALSHDLIGVLRQRARRHARSLRHAVGAVTTARRDAWQCAAQVAGIGIMSLTLAWCVWDTTVEQRQAVARSEPSVEGRLKGSLVDTDVTAELEAQRRAAPGEVGGEVADDSPDTVSDGGSASSPLGGWVMSVAAVSAVLMVGAGAVVLVVRRHRRRSWVQPEQHVLPTVDQLPDPPPRDDSEADDTAESEADDGSLHAPAGDADEGTREVTDQIDAEVTSTIAFELADARSGSLNASSPSWAGGDIALTGLSAQGSALMVGEPVASRIEARERLFERRASPRIEYVRPGTMAWRGVQSAMTVRDLSGTGLRLGISAPNASPLPGTKDYVEVQFPVDGGRVRVKAQVAWRRTTSDVTEIGVVFRRLSAEDAELIHDTCVART